MRKILLGTTALVAVTAVMAGTTRADLSVTGSTIFGVGGGNVEGNAASMSQNGGTQTNGDFDIYETGEVIFNGSTDMDNGMDLSWEVILKADTGETDGNFIDVGGDFGAFVIGQESLPNKKMHYTGGMFVGNAGLSSGTYSSFTGSPGGLSYFNSGFMNDAAPVSDKSNMLSYYSPRMSGVQVGLGYTPNSGGTSHTNEAKLALEFEDIVSVGVNYTDDGMMMDGMTVALSGGYTSSDVGGYDPAATTRISNGLSTYQAGLNLGFGGLTLGVSYMGQNTGKNAGDKTDKDGESIAILKAGDTQNVFFGATYATGPHTVGLTSVLAKAEETSQIKGDTEGKAIMLAHDYAMGGGVNLTTSITFLDVGDEDPASNESADGVAGMMLIGAEF